MKTKIIPFDIELAKKIQAGEIEGRIVTKNGNRVRIICFDSKRMLERDIIALVEDDDLTETIGRYRTNGELIGRICGDDDLFIELPEETPKQKVKLDETIKRLANEYESETEKNAFFSGITFAVSVDAEYRDELGICGYKENIPEKEETPKHNSFSNKLHDTAEVLATPTHEFKPFDKVLVRNEDHETWSARLYDIWFTEIGLHGTQDNKEYKQCIQYEGHENLVGTTDKPKEE